MGVNGQLTPKNATGPCLNLNLSSGGTPRARRNRLTTFSFTLSFMAASRKPGIPDAEAPFLRRASARARAARSSGESWGGGGLGREEEEGEGGVADRVLGTVRVLGRAGVHVDVLVEVLLHHLVAESLGLARVEEG